MRTQLAPKTIRRLLAADGFLDLGMADRAVQELEAMTDAGILEGPKQLLLGISRKHLKQVPAAISHLEAAARIMPAPVRRFAWKELAECYESVGSTKLAAMAKQLAGDGEWNLRIALPATSETIQLMKTPRSSGEAV